MILCANNFPLIHLSFIICSLSFAGIHEFTVVALCPSVPVHHCYKLTRGREICIRRKKERKTSYLKRSLNIKRIYLEHEIISTETAFLKPIRRELLLIYSSTVPFTVLEYKSHNQPVSTVPLSECREINQKKPSTYSYVFNPS